MNSAEAGSSRIGEHADEVGEEGVGRPLEVRVLVQVVVEVPALVADPEVVALALHHVGEGHEVGRHDLVHVPQGVEGVQLVVRGPALEVRALVRRRRSSPGAGARPRPRPRGRRGRRPGSRR